LVVCNLKELPHLAAVERLFASIWGGGSSQTAMPVNLLVALLHSGGYVGGALLDGELAAAAVGFLARREGMVELHSHVTGVAVELQGSGIGLALKEHQRGWAASHGIPAITWTFDPLSRRNGWFNLAKLGAQAVSYHPNFYGAMPDAQNGDDDTDRCMARLTTGGTFSPRSLDIVTNREVHLALEVGAGDRPHRFAVDLDAPVISCQVPPDIVAIRRADPALARSWRFDLRAAMGLGMAAGYVATSISRDGFYQLLHPSLMRSSVPSVPA
jgi:predicted GNAT superfamily acetyltransferase